MGRALILAAVLVVAFATAAFAAGTKGSPQPGLARFDLLAKGGDDGSGTVLPDGNTLLEWESTGSSSDVTVCVLHPGATKCASTATIKPYKDDSFYGSARIIATGGNNVTVVANDCCHIGLAGGVVYNSTNGGKTFGKETQVGNISGVSAVTFADGQIVVSPDDSSDGTQVQAFSPTSKTIEENVATLDTTGDEDIALSTYKDGVLVASDGGSDTRVWYAPSGSNFNSKKSYKLVDVVKGQDVEGMSGDALLTSVNSEGLTAAKNIQLFNGTSFSTEKRVPAPTHPDDGAYNIEEVGSTAYIVFLDRGLSWDIFSEFTSNGGKSWSALSQYSSAIDANALIPVLGSSGAGLCFEPGTPLWVQPILNAQHVSVSVKSSKLDGTASPKLKGETVTLESESGAYWDNVSTSKESSSGTFSFSVKSGTTYRAVVTGEPGYYLYGYSNSVKG